MRRMNRWVAAAQEGCNYFTFNIAPTYTVWKNFDVKAISGTGIRSIDNGQLIIDNDAWYDMSGRRLDGKPAQRGIYVNHGKKVVIK